MNVLKGKNKETEIVVLRHYLITVSEVRMSLVYDSLTKWPMAWKGSWGGESL